MFIGHFAVAFAAKPLAPRRSLGTLFVAAQFVDLLWPTLLLLGVERVVIDPALSGAPLDFAHYPISHSLVAAMAWGVLLGLGCYAITRDRRGAVVVGVLVVSHWLLDFIVHRPDLPLWIEGGPWLGLGLWNFPRAELGVELALFAVCFALYLRTPSGRSAGIKPWVLAALLVAIQVANAFGPPPPSVEAVAWIGQAQWLLVAAAYWADRPTHSSAIASGPANQAQGLPGAR
jgi:membrane-bound metal-dependent hydrolase YbcI (DUF457 family)